MVLDTNVVSELIRQHPARNVVDWLARQQASEFATTVITEAEMRAGHRRALAGHRSREMLVSIERILSGFRILPLDSAATLHYAEIVAQRRVRAGDLGR